MDEVDNKYDESGDQEAPRRSGPSRKYPWAILVVIVLFVIVPFVSWYGTWFGRPLSNDKMEEYLHDRNKPRNVQHALAEVSRRITEKDQSVKRWYPAVIEAASNDSPEVRMTAAWVMGQDNTQQDFHLTLGPMISDSSAGVRHNAALALVRFGDASARPALVEMLQPTMLQAEYDGTIELIVKEESAALAPGTPLLRIKKDNGEIVEMHSREAGRIETIAVADGARVTKGTELMSLSPESEQVRSALVALYLMGQPDDIPYVQRYVRQTGTMPDTVQKQALSTLEAIRERTGKVQ